MTGGDEASGFENESGTVPPWPVSGPEPDTDAMPSLLPELPAVRRSARDQVVELLTPYMENEPGTRDGLFAWDVLEHISHQEQYMSARQRLDQATAAGVTP